MRQVGEGATDLETVGDLPAEVVDQHVQRIVGEGLVEHLGGAQRRAGVADQRVRHGAEAALVAEVVRRGVGGVADEAPGVGLAPGLGRADARGVRHHLGHLRAGAVPGIHRDEADVGQIGAHEERVERGDARRTELLQEHRLQVDQLPERSRDIEERLAGADPVALLEAQLDRELGAAGAADLEQPVERELGGAQHRAAHEHGVGGIDVAEPPHDLAGLQEILVGKFRQLIRGRSHDGFSSALRTDSNYGLAVSDGKTHDPVRRASPCALRRR